MILHAYGEQFSCSKAVKGEDFIYLENEQGDSIARFEGISDFAEYTLKDGAWTTPAPDQIDTLQNSLLAAQQTITDQDLALIAAQQAITDNDLRLLALEEGQAV